MPEEKRRRLDLLALVLLAVNLFLAVAVFSYDPADPPSTLVYPPRAETRNACGPLGALAARVLFGAFGMAAYFVAASLATVTVLLLMRREISDAALRLGGWLLTLLGLTTSASFLLPQLGPGPVIGPGGYLGATGRGLLEAHFATAGSFILIVSVLICGVTLCAEEMMGRLTRFGLRTVRNGIDRLLPSAECGVRNAELSRPVTTRAKKGPGRDKKQRSDVNAERGIAVAGGPANSEIQNLKSEIPNPKSEIEKPSIAERLASALRIKNRRAKPDNGEAMRADLDSASRGDGSIEYELPPLELLKENETFNYEEQEVEVRQKASALEQAFASFGLNVRVVEIETGPVISQYEVELEAGLRLSKVTSLADDLAVALRVPSVRVVAPLPGKNTVGIEIPNAQRQLVRLREVMEEADAKAGRMHIPVYLGKDVAGSPMTVDLTSLPHLLIAGRTGTGKSVCLNTLIMSMLMTRRPDEVKMLLIDPKMVELTPYARLPHLMHPVITDMKKAEAVLAWAVDKMEERYALLMRAGVRHMSVYNQLGEEELRARLKPESEEEWQQIPTHLPYIVIVADELADLIMTAPKEVESHIIRLAQKSRAVGIHLVLATQKPTVDVITGLIKSNLPARISFQVSSRIDSRVVLDEMGADKLLGNGDLLYLSPGTSTLSRGQGAFVSDDEIRDVVDFLATNEPQFVAELVQLKPKASGGRQPPDDAGAGDKDDLYEPAVDIVVREGRGSVSLLQRSLGIGYGRAARLIDYMAEDGIVGPYNGSQAREVLITSTDWAGMRGEGAEDDASEPSRLPPVARPAKAKRPRAAAKNGQSETDDDLLTGDGDDDAPFELEDAAEDSLAE
jgi:S-DNA-T family DNA segregation ATPase FtsK/SpoIIIE